MSQSLYIEYYGQFTKIQLEKLNRITNTTFNKHDLLNHIYHNIWSLEDSVINYLNGFSIKELCEQFKLKNSGENKDIIIKNIYKNHWNETAIQNRLTWEKNWVNYTNKELEFVLQSFNICGYFKNKTERIEKIVKNIGIDREDVDNISYINNYNSIILEYNSKENIKLSDQDLSKKYNVKISYVKKWRELPYADINIWKEHPIFTGYYSTRSGRVFNFKKGEELFGTNDLAGYSIISVKSLKICKHIFTAEVYLNNPNNYKQIDHQNGDKMDNSVGILPDYSDSNLKYVSVSENNKNKPSIKFEITQYDDKMNFIKNWDGYFQIKEVLGISTKKVRMSCNTGTIINGYIFKFKNKKAKRTFDINDKKFTYIGLFEDDEEYDYYINTDDQIIVNSKGIEIVQNKSRQYSKCSLESKLGNARQIYFHRIAMFIKNNRVCMKNHVVDHINNNSLDNRLDNLQYLSSAQNVSKACSRCIDQYDPITKKIIKTYSSMLSVTEEIKEAKRCSLQTACMSGKIYCNYHWKYTDGLNNSTEFVDIKMQQICKVNKCDPITNKIINKYESIQDAQKDNIHTTRKSIKKACDSESIYVGFKWVIITR